MITAVSPWPVLAEGQLRIAVYESLGYPLSVYDKDRQLTGGMQKEFGDKIAKFLDGNAVCIAYSRLRIETSSISGQAALLCYPIPKWF